MTWTAPRREDAEVNCRYCGNTGKFPNHAAFDYLNATHELFACPACGSLHYDPMDLSGNDTSTMSADQRENGHRYYLETGYSPDYVVRAALVGLPDSHPLRFVDAGCGAGLALYFAREILGLPASGFEPTESGALGRELFDLDIRPVWLDRNSVGEAAEFANQPCFLHFNSVLEHLDDPRETLEGLIHLLPVKAISAVVPSGLTVNRSSPFIEQISFLAPGDHGHFPTPKGMRLMFRNLGFEHVHVGDFGSLMHVAASSEPIHAMSDRALGVATDHLLLRLSGHPHPWVSKGAHARLVVRLTARGQHAAAVPHMKAIGVSFDKPMDAEMERAPDSGRDWNGVPFYTGAVSFWLGVACMMSQEADHAIEHFGTLDRFVERLRIDYPQYALQPIVLNWEAKLLTARILRTAGREAEANALLESIVAAGQDSQNGPSGAMVAKARTALAA